MVQMEFPALILLLRLSSIPFNDFWSSLLKKIPNLPPIFLFGWQWSNLRSDFSIIRQIKGLKKVHLSFKNSIDKVVALIFMSVGSKALALQICFYFFSKFAFLARKYSIFGLEKFPLPLSLSQHLLKKKIQH